MNPETIARQLMKYRGPDLGKMDGVNVSRLREFIEQKQRYNNSGIKYAVLLPSHYSEVLSKQEGAHNRIIVDDPSYNFLDPLSFDAESFIPIAIETIKRNKCQAVVAFDCFPNLLASIINHELRDEPSWLGTGPSLASCFLCANKYYMRLALDKTVPVFRYVDEAEYPAVMKMTDTQFYTGTHPVKNQEDALEATKIHQNYSALIRNHSGPFPDNLKRRQQFYHRYLTKHASNFCEIYGIRSADDIVMVFMEPFLGGGMLREQQVEVVVQDEVIVADTGDIIKSKESKAAQMFKTRTSLSLDIWKAWVRERVDILRHWGWNWGAMDIEFVYDDISNSLHLIEVNSRYSFMGYQRYEPVHRTKIGNNHELHDAVISRINAREASAKAREMRNYTNRTELAIRQKVTYIPLRDDVTSCIVAFCMYAKPSATYDFFTCFAEPPVLPATDGVDAYVPEGIPGSREYLSGKDSSENAELQQYNGYAKIGWIFLTIENDAEFIREKCNAYITNCFSECKLPESNISMIPILQPSAKVAFTSLLFRT